MYRMHGIWGFHNWVVFVSAKTFTANVNLPVSVVNAQHVPDFVGATLNCVVRGRWLLLRVPTTLNRTVPPGIGKLPDYCSLMIKLLYRHC